jgi:hypothetical protein
MCGAHKTFHDWSTHQGLAFCETTSVTWHFLQPLLKRFPRTPDPRSPEVTSVFVTEHPYLGNASTFMGTDCGHLSIVQHVGWLNIIRIVELDHIAQHLGLAAIFGCHTLPCRKLPKSALEFYFF